MRSNRWQISGNLRTPPSFRTREGDAPPPPDVESPAPRPSLAPPTLPSSSALPWRRYLLYCHAMRRPSPFASPFASRRALPSSSSSSARALSTTTRGSVRATLLDPPDPARAPPPPGCIHIPACPLAHPSATKYRSSVHALPPADAGSPSVPNTTTVPSGTPPPSRLSRSARPELTSVWPWRPGRVPATCVAGTSTRGATASRGDGDGWGGFRDARS